MPNFEVFRNQRGRGGRWGAQWADVPGVTIQRGGSFLINAAAYRALGEPAHVQLLFDRDARVIGFESVAEPGLITYPVRATSGNSYQVSSRAFTTHYGIDVTVTRRWPATVEDGILCIDLNDEPATAVTNR